MAQGQEKSRSIFDFLYVDQPRLELYLAQFSEFGNLTGLVRSVAQSDQREIAGSIHIIKGGTKSGATTELEKHYDPRWIAPLTFLEEVSDRGILKGNIEEIGVGDFVLLKGKLILVDCGALEGAFKTAAEVERPIPKGNRHERRGSAARGQPVPVSNLEEFTPFKMLAGLEQPLIMYLASGDSRFWSTMDSSHLVGGRNDLHLKHGVKIAGDWNLIGIIDCLPGYDDSPPERFCGDGDNVFSAGLASTLGEIRKIMGRPSNCWGITPLIIMREAAARPV